MSGQLLKVDLTAPGTVKWHNRMQPLVEFFIDGGSQLDLEDQNWDLYIVTEEHQDEQFAVAGFCTVYNFFKYPDNTRLRVSQVLVLPPYQGRGHGRRLLETVCEAAVASNCHEVTVEDPTDDFQTLRETVDVQRLLNFPPVVAAISSTVDKAHALESQARAESSDCGVPSCSFNLAAGSELEVAARKGLKISPKQLQRCWEVLLYLRTSDQDSQLRCQWRSMVTKRLYAEEFGGQRIQKTAYQKRVFDIDLHRDKVMFIMTRFRKQDTALGNDTGDDDLSAATAETTSEEQMLAIKEGLKQLVSHRLQQVVHIASKVKPQALQKDSP